MLPEKINRILSDLNMLLADDLSPHIISYKFKNTVACLNEEHLQIDKVECKEYYEDGDLSLVLLMKNEAIVNGQFELASKFRLLEKELLEEKGSNEFTKLKTEAFSFEFRNNSVIFHFNKRKENQRLIANLIEGHNLHYQKERISGNACELSSLYSGNSL